MCGINDNSSFIPKLELYKMLNNQYLNIIMTFQKIQPFVHFQPIIYIYMKCGYEVLGIILTAQSKGSHVT
jgi:hypothetical protein